MTADELKGLLSTRPHIELLDPCLREDLVPFVFERSEASWSAFKSEVGSGLDVSPADIRIVGSGRFGFSLKPGNNFKAYSDKSDVDVVVINHELFDYLWHGLLRAAYPRPPAVTQLGGWLIDRQKELYTGWLTPLAVRLDPKIFGDNARPVSEFNVRWFNTLKKASRLVVRRHEDITGRLYRTWQHAEMYHLNSLGSLKRTI